MFTPFTLKRRPDQTSYSLNQLASKLQEMEGSIKVISSDRKNVIIIGNGHPIDPKTKKPYPFGIRKYRISGDRLTLERELL